MLRFRHTAFFVLALSLAVTPLAGSQGKGKGKDEQGQGEAKGKGKGKEKEKGGGKEQTASPNKEKGQDRGRANAGDRKSDGGTGGSAISSRTSERGNSKSAARGNGGKAKFARMATPSTMPQSIRKHASSKRAQDVIVAAALSHAYSRGRENDFRMDPVGDGWRVVNLRGEQLVFLDQERARDLGKWRVGLLDDDVREGGPAFCRSGQGHPVWGRQWCLEKGFGLGGYEDFRWGRRLDPGDITFSQGSIRDQLIGSALEQVLGTNTFNRLALHAVTLGLVEPLVGSWYTEPTGSQLLRVNSGQYPVAELVDNNRDFRVDDLLVALRSWL